MKSKYIKIILPIIFFISIQKLLAQSHHPGVINLSVEAGGMGNAVAQLPIFCSPGRLNMQPQISLSYNSAAPSGLCGKGWNINGTSVISRTSRNYHLNNGIQEGIQFTPRDLFILDGQALKLTKGNYGENNSTYQTEQDGFSLISFVNGTFIVEHKNGGKSFYGNTTNSKQFARTNAAQILSWYLTRTYDANGNYIEYLYETIDNQVLLKEIKYTGFDATLNGTTPSSEPQESTFNSVVFSYTNRTNAIEKRFINGFEFTGSKLLEDVKSYSGNTLLRKYIISYTQDPVNIIPNKIEEENGFGESLEPATLLWHDDGTFDRILDINNTDSRDYRITGDFNGDGKTDLAIFSYLSTNDYSNYIRNYDRLTIFTYTEEQNRRFYKIIFNERRNFEKVTHISAADIDLDGDDDLIYQTTQVNFSTVNNSCSSIKKYDNHTIHYHGLISKGNLNFSLMEHVFPMHVNSEVGYYNFKDSEINDLLKVEPIIADMDGDGMLDLTERIIRKETEPESTSFNCGLSTITYRKPTNIIKERIQVYLSTKRHLPNIQDRYTHISLHTNL